MVRGSVSQSISILGFRSGDSGSLLRGGVGDARYRGLAFLLHDVLSRRVSFLEGNANGTSERSRHGTRSRFGKANAGATIAFADDRTSPQPSLAGRIA